MLIRVRVKTAAKKEEVVHISGDRYEVSLKEKPEQNAANTRLISVLATHLAVPLNTLRIVSGHKKPRKIVTIIESN